VSKEFTPRPQKQTPQPPAKQETPPPKAYRPPSNAKYRNTTHKVLGVSNIRMKKPTSIYARPK